MDPIITSLLDTDHYKMTMGQIVYKHFDWVKARYSFFNRNDTYFPAGFDRLLQNQVNKLSSLWLKEDEYYWLEKMPYMSAGYLKWLKTYTFNPDEVKIKLESGKLSVDIEGDWKNTIYWEVPLMAIISELYFRQSTCEARWRQKLYDKYKELERAGCLWSDFGTRRRFSKKVQEFVVALGGCFHGFLGTSNQQLAKELKLKAIGTYAHEGPMAMQAYTVLRSTNKTWMETWRKEYGKNLSIVLPDTLTSKFCLENSPVSEWNGVRHDSGEPEEFANMVLEYYKNHGIDSTEKTIIFSDGIDPVKLINLTKKFSDRIKVVGGIGTNLTNDVGVKPLNMVIKMTDADFGNGFKPVVKLSDNKGKYTGDKNRIEYVLKIISGTLDN